MKTTLAAIIAALALCPLLDATTISVVPVFEPLSLHETDGDEAISDTGDALQACVMSRPMAMTGALPEDIIDAIRTPHKLPTNNQNYDVQEANLLVLCKIGINATDVEGKIAIKIDVAEMSIPKVVDLTARQLINLTIVAIRKTLEIYQEGHDKPLQVQLVIVGTTELNADLKELNAELTIGQEFPTD